MNSFEEFEMDENGVLQSLENGDGEKFIHYLAM